MMDEVKRTMSEGTLRAISTPVSTGTRRVHSEIWKVRESPSVYCSTYSSVAPPFPNPTMKNITRAMRKVGIVVSII